MTTISRHPVIYSNYELRNDGAVPGRDPLGTINCVIEETYRRPLLNQANEYIVAVERMEVPLNGVPFMDAFQMTFVDSQGPAGVPDQFVMFVNRSYSLVGLVKRIELAWQLLQPRPFRETELAFQNRPGAVNRFEAGLQDFLVGVDPAGFFQMHFNGGLETTNSLNVPNLVQARLGLRSTYGPQVEVPDIWESATPRWDMGDNLHRLQLKTTLPTVSDRVGESTSGIITDFSIPSLVAGSTTRHPADQNSFELDWSQTTSQWSPRQRLIYTPVERRFLNLRSSIPINDITLSLQYVTPEGLVRPVELPEGGSFSVKLGFWSTKGDPNNRHKDINAFLDERGFARYT